MSRYYTAAEIAQLYGVAIGTVYAYASLYHWRRTHDRRHPVLYHRDDVDHVMSWLKANLTPDQDTSIL